MVKVEKAERKRRGKVWKKERENVERGGENVKKKEEGM